MTSQPIVEMRNVSKRFPGTLALNGVDLTLEEGKIHALLGENGAGKSTLMHILSGLYQEDAGTIRIADQEVTIDSPLSALRLGIGMVHQQSMLIETCTVVENIALGVHKLGLVIPRNQIQRTLLELSEAHNLPVNPDAFVYTLDPGQRQRVEILKMLFHGGRVLILDEPTSILTPEETRGLFNVMRSLANQGQSIVFISHKLNEVLEIADTVTVLRKGNVVAHLDSLEDITSDDLARHMVGNDVELDSTLERTTFGSPSTLLDVNDLFALDGGHTSLSNINLTVSRGEIIGIAGVSGNGQSTLMRVLSGILQPTSGSVYVHGKPTHRLTPRLVRQLGIASISDDHSLHVFLDSSTARNIGIGDHHRPPFSRLGLMRWRMFARIARTLVSVYGIVPTNVHTLVGSLSGGNRQRVLLARELKNDPSIILAMNPTQGLDVVATNQTHVRLITARNAGAGVILISSDLDEILALSDRVFVMRDGMLIGPIEADNGSLRQNIGLALGGD